MSFISLLQGFSGGQSGLFTMGTMVLVFAVFYFLLIRPQKKEQKKMQQMISEVKKGDKIVTIGGIHGVITSLKEKTIVIKVDESCRIEINRSAIGTVNAKTTTDVKTEGKN